ncbi:MAG: lipopolysaccharide biosynthesis protein [Caulobacteraceae bacterium]
MKRPLIFALMRSSEALSRKFVLTLSARTGVAIVGLAVTPIYLRFLGPQAYGLVGFWIIAQAWMIVFDLGVSPAVARQLSRFKAGVLDSREAGSLLFVGELIFAALALLAAAAFFLLAPQMRAHWLGRSSLAAGEVELALKLMGALLAVRWLTGFYQSALMGLERQVESNCVALAGLALRSAASVACLAFVAADPAVFFWAQLAGAAIEAVANRILLWRLGPAGRPDWKAGWRALRAEGRFAATVAVGCLIATLINEVDKLALSHALPLGDFGLFSLVVTICTGVRVVMPPILGLVQPRLTALIAQGRQVEFFGLYRLSSCLVVVLAGALAGTLAAQPQAVLLAWTGSAAVAAKISTVLSLYALGAGLSALMVLPFLLQYAAGRAGLHLTGNLIFGAFWIPAAVWAAFRFGAIGTGAVGLIGNLGFLLLWRPIVHRTFLTRGERRDLAKEEWAMIAAMAAVLLAARLLVDASHSRAGALSIVGVVAALAGAAGVGASRTLRSYAARALAVRDWRSPASLAAHAGLER